MGAGSSRYMRVCMHPCTLHIHVPFPTGSGVAASSMAVQHMLTYMCATDLMHDSVPQLVIAAAWGIDWDPRGRRLYFAEEMYRRWEGPHLSACHPSACMCMYIRTGHADSCLGFWVFFGQCVPLSKQCNPS